MPDPRCAVCGRDPSTCLCPECPVCGEVGNPACYVGNDLVDGDHGIAETDEQIASAIANDENADFD